MAGMFLDFGRALLAGGYLVTPIKPGHKRPALEQWQTARLGVADLANYPGCGIGVLCGQGAWPIAAIDIDTTDADLAARFAAWCQSQFGGTVERIGFAPKTLLVYRAEADGWAKRSSAWFDDLAGGAHRLEVLGHGQQFVAYHVHPDTGRPYEWVDLVGGLEHVRAADLPVITADQVAAAVAMFEAMAQDAQLERRQTAAAVRARTSSSSPADPDDPLMNHNPPIGVDIGEARRLLQWVDNQDYDAWLRVGLSLHHEYQGADDALALWDEWSASAPNYRGVDDLAMRWQGFGRRGGQPTTIRWLLKVGREGQRVATRAVKRDALREARDAIAECEDSIDLLAAVARQAGEAAGDDLAVKNELLGLLRTRFNVLTKTPLPVADARIAMAAGRKAAATKAADPVADPRRGRTEFGNAERMLDNYGAGLLYVPELDTWHAWTGVYWRSAARVEIEHLAKETIRALTDEVSTIDSDEEREAFLKFCAVSQRAAMVGNMVDLARSDPRVVVPVAELDKRSHLFGVANGAVDLRTGKLLAPNPKHYITIVSPIEYNPDAAAPLFEQTLLDVFSGDAGMVEFFQRLIGYAMTGQPDQDVIVIPHGGGSNGKSTVLGTIREVFGGYARMASADTFVNGRGQGGGNAGQAREDVLRLRGARFVYVSEPEEGAELREGMIKSMTGGEAMPARGLWSRNTVEVVPTWVAFMATNHKPIVKGDDFGIWRRLMLVPFLRNFDRDPAVAKDTDRAARLREEWPGILAWCVRGALAYRSKGLAPPKAVQAAGEAYRDEMDLLAEWLAQCCEQAPDASATSVELWASWEQFARSNGEVQLIRCSRTLMRRIATRFPVVSGKARQRRALGVRVKALGDLI